MALEERKARITRRGDRSAETTGACPEQRAMPSLRASGAPQFDVPCEGGSRASLKAKKCAAAPETMNSAADMVLDSAAEERRQRCKQAWPVALPRPRERQPATAGEAARSFGKQAAALGKAAPAPKPPKACANDAAIIKATDRDPCLVASPSGAGRVAKRVWAAPASAQRMSIIRRLDEFAKAHGSEMSRGNAPLLIVSLKLARSSAVQRTRAPLSPMAAGEAPAQMLPSALRGAAAENPTRRTPPMMRREPHLVCNAMGSERGRVAVRLAWVTAGRCDKSRCCGRKNLSSTRATATPSLSTGALCQKHSRQPCAEQRAVWRSRARMPPRWEDLLQKRWLGSGSPHLACVLWKKPCGPTPRRRNR
ncbi:hypothetical protein ERJ75_001247100 [Trypanosoma vivax]|nr:hypothetical protein ERJ75_001247100 [Trypanosoma vivax]